MTNIDHTHRRAARSWVDSANLPDEDFPVQNLPFAVFRPARTSEAYRGGVAIGTWVLDLGALADTNLLQGQSAEALRAAARSSLNALFALGAPTWRQLRHDLFALLEDTASESVQAEVRKCLIPQDESEYKVGVDIGDYTDFYTSVDHARNIGRIYRPEAPLTPNFTSIPIAYHGRVSTIKISGTPVRRPQGQVLVDGEARPQYLPTSRLDFEVELGVYVGTGNEWGEPIKIGSAEDHVFGIGLLNDWSARDVQRWEALPLGPFLAKNFATSVGPWIVTMDALAPYRSPWGRPLSDPPPLAYLESPQVRATGAIDINLSTRLHVADPISGTLTANRIAETSFRHQYWTVSHMLAHHTANGCDLRTGDLIGTGTISGPTPNEAGSLLELSYAGSRPLRLEHGAERTFLEDGDTVSITGWCERENFARIGFGTVFGTVVPST